MMENNSEFHGTESGLLPFDLIVLVRDVLRKWLVVLAVSLMVGVGAYVLTDLRYEPVYSSTTTFVVTTRSSSSTVYKNLTSTTSLASVFSDLMNSSLMRKTVLNEAGLGHFRGTISASAIPETNLLTLKVTDSDPATAYLVNRAIVEGHEALTYEVDQILIVKPHELDGLAIEEGKDYCTLVTCTPYGINTHRLLVRGVRIETVLEKPTVRVTADAVRVEPLIVAPILVSPLLVLLLLVVALYDPKKK